MRLHCFATPSPARSIYIDLDNISAIVPDGDGTLIYVGVACFRVGDRLADVLRLISPPVTPDTYEEDLAKSNDAISAAVQRIRNRMLAEYDYTPDAREFEARIDEVEWIIANWNKFKPAELFEYALRRHAELIGLKRKAVA